MKFFISNKHPDAIKFLFCCSLLSRPSSAADILKTSQNNFVEFRFLSPVTRFQFNQPDYHIVQINIPEIQNAKYTVHLSKMNNIDAVNHLQIDDNENYNCLYTGVVTSADEEDLGTVSWSSCFHEAGFEGLLYIQDEIYHVTPAVTYSSNSQHKLAEGEDSQPSQVTIQHTVKKSRTTVFTTRSSKTLRKDGIRVPEKELLKARTQMLKDQESLEDESIVDENHEANFQANAKNINRNNVTRPPKKTSWVIELAIFTDDAFYKQWSQRYPKNTNARINQYLLALVNNMNFLYQQPSLNPNITFRLVNIEVQQIIPFDLPPSTNAEIYLKSFCTYAGNKDENRAKWDHAMMITGMELQDGLGTDNLGIAYTSTMCLRYWSCSLVEYNMGFETAFVAAHEIGHSLGMDHDGVAMNLECDQSKFIMAAVSGPGQVNWSPCSSKNVQNFLTSGDPNANIKEPSKVPVCLTKKSSKVTEITYKTGRYPGKIFGAKRQCLQACSKCTPYIRKQTPYNNICSSLYCANPEQKIFAAHPALEGTSCGPKGKKICRNGRCQ